MSFDSRDPSQDERDPLDGDSVRRDTTVRQPDGLVVPRSSLGGTNTREDLDEDMVGPDGGVATAPATGLDIDSINFAELNLFASQETTKIDIPHSDFHVIVKNELDFGEQATLDSISIRGIQRNELDGMESGSMVVLDVAKQRLYNLAMHIVGWNFKTPDRWTRNGDIKPGEPIRLPRTLEERVKLFRRMNPLLGQALTELIQRHIDQHSRDVKRVEAAEEHRMGLMPATDDEQDAPPKRMTSGASAM